MYLFDSSLEQLYFQNRVAGYSGVSVTPSIHLRLLGVNNMIQKFINLIIDMDGSSGRSCASVKL